MNIENKHLTGEIKELASYSSRSDAKAFEEFCEGMSNDVDDVDYNDEMSSKLNNDIMQIFVRDSKTRTINCCKTDTIMHIREQYGKKLNIPMSCVKLVYGGKKLEDNLTLAHYNIQANSTLFAH